MGCAETRIPNHHSTLRKFPEESRSHSHRGRVSLKSRIETNGAESFSRSWYFLSWWSNFPHYGSQRLHYRLHISPPLVPVLTDINQSTPFHPIQNLMLCFRLPQYFQVVSCPQDSPPKPVCTPSVFHACCKLPLLIPLRFHETNNIFWGLK